MKPSLMVIAGPTASGKSETAVETARILNAEVISADSMQVYRYMDIGSAKITKEEEMGVPHHLIDVSDPDEAFDVTQYALLAKECVTDIRSRGRLPILCGGTGFYIQAVVRDIDFTEGGMLTDYRKELSDYADRFGNEALHESLAGIDPESAAVIHPNNRKRVIRALEFFKETGEPIARHNEEEKLRSSPYDVYYYVLDDDRDFIYRKIDDRVDFMMEEGLVSEVSYLRSMGLSRNNVSMQGLGYKEMLDYLDGKCTLEEAVRVLKRDTRHFAKRQITWFKREQDAIWIDRKKYERDPRKIADWIKRDYLQKRKEKEECNDNKGTISSTWH